MIHWMRSGDRKKKQQWNNIVTFLAYTSSILMDLAPDGTAFQAKLVQEFLIAVFLLVAVEHTHQYSWAEVIRQWKMDLSLEQCALTPMVARMDVYSLTILKYDCVLETTTCMNCQEFPHGNAMQHTAVQVSIAILYSFFISSLRSWIIHDVLKKNAKSVM